MKLRDLPTPRGVVPVGDHDFSVRGLSPNDAMQLYYRHAGVLSGLFDHVVKQAAEAGEAADVANMVGTTLIASSPQIMAEIITIASDALPDDEGFAEDVAAVMKFPAGTQIRALELVASLTFTSDMPPGKFLALVITMLQSARASVSVPST